METHGNVVGFRSKVLPTPDISHLHLKLCFSSFVEEGIGEGLEMDIHFAPCPRIIPYCIYPVGLLTPH